MLEDASAIGSELAVKNGGTKWQLVARSCGGSGRSVVDVREAMDAIGAINPEWAPGRVEAVPEMAACCTEEDAAEILACQQENLLALARTDKAGVEVALSPWQDGAAPKTPVAALDKLAEAAGWRSLAFNGRVIWQAAAAGGNEVDMALAAAVGKLADVFADDE